MPRTREQLEQAAADAEAWLDSLDPSTTSAEETNDLRHIGLALGDVAKGEAAVADAVAIARANGRSWSEIGLVLGVSKQAARQRFGEIEATRKR
ncbi:MAG: sigma-70 family RNA polymerase sigma factor [Acidimicrobiia bacterium]